MDYRKEIQELRQTLTENGYLYYVLDAPTMSDYEYDHLMRRLRNWKPGTRRRSRRIRPPSG